MLCNTDGRTDGPNTVQIQYKYKTKYSANTILFQTGMFCAANLPLSFLQTRLS